MFVKVFVLGRPGSGKSTAIQRIKVLADRWNIPTTSIKDYTILREMFEQDIEHKKFQPAECGGFDVTDFSVLDEVLQQLEMKVEMLEDASPEPKEILTIEFARDNYYKALNNFTSRFLKNAYFLFINADLENACIKRIHKRRMGTSLSEDRHSVSDDIMRTYYSTHNWAFTQQRLMRERRGLPHVTTLENNGPIEDFEQSVISFTEMVLNESFFNNKRVERHTQPLNIQPPLPDRPIEVMSKAAVVDVTL